MVKLIQSVEKRYFVQLESSFLVEMLRLNFAASRFRASKTQTNAPKPRFEAKETILFPKTEVIPRMMKFYESTDALDVKKGDIILKKGKATLLN